MSDFIIPNFSKRRFTIQEFHKQFPDDDACLEAVFQMRYGDLDICPHCSKKFSYYRTPDRKRYKCAYCGNDLRPLADTIFHKSSTPLKLWFHAIYLFSVSKNGVSAKELERQLGVTYKTAWRMAKQIRLLFEQEAGEKFSGVVEVDETYVGGKPRKNEKSKRGRGAAKKAPVIGLVERQGEVRVYVSQDTKTATIMPLIERHIDTNARVITDEYASYNRVSLHGYKHDRIRHSEKKYVVGDVHTNTMEGFWSQLKRGINGTYHSVSPKYLQTYANEFAYRYNKRHEGPLFPYLLPQAACRIV